MHGYNHEENHEKLSFVFDYGLSLGDRNRHLYLSQSVELYASEPVINEERVLNFWVEPCAFICILAVTVLQPWFQITDYQILLIIFIFVFIISIVNVIYIHGVLILLIFFFLRGES